jgi:hypothetical protein
MLNDRLTGMLNPGKFFPDVMKILPAPKFSGLKLEPPQHLGTDRNSGDDLHLGPI